MSVKQDLKKVKKDVLKFKNLVKKDKEVAIVLAKEIRVDIKKVLEYSDIKKDKSIIKKLCKLDESLRLYLHTIKTFDNFKKKWD